MTNKRAEQFKRLLDNYYSAGDRREWDATTQAEKALKKFGAVMQGNQWVDMKAEPDSAAIYDILISCCYSLVLDDMSGSIPPFKYGWRSIEYLIGRGFSRAVVEHLQTDGLLSYRKMGIEAYPVYKISPLGMEWLTEYQSKSEA
jgi:hypothetical protein